MTGFKVQRSPPLPRRQRQDGCGLPCLTLLRPGLLGTPGAHPEQATPPPCLPHTQGESQSPGRGREEGVELSTSETVPVVKQRQEGARPPAQGWLVASPGEAQGPRLGPVQAASLRDASERFWRRATMRATPEGAGVTPEGAGVTPESGEQKLVRTGSRCPRQAGGSGYTCRAPRSPTECLLHLFLRDGNVTGSHPTPSGEPSPRPQP